MQLVLRLLTLSAFLSVALASSAETKSQLEPYRTDACTAPFGLAAPNWMECCTSHDFSYWVGGSLKDKQKADARLINCLSSKGESGSLAAKIFDLAPERLSLKHWGSRWHPPRPDLPLSEEEIEQVRKYQKSFSLPIPIVEDPSGRDCLLEVRSELARITRIPSSSAITCYDLAKTSKEIDVSEEMIYSPACSGYFVVQKKNAPKSSIVLIGYGECARLFRNPDPKSLPPPKVHCRFTRSKLQDFFNLLKAPRN